MSYERDNIQRMQGYPSGEQPADGDDVIKLNTNENPYPPSPRVDQALTNISGEDLRTYPPPTAAQLRRAIADRHALDAGCVLVTNGGDEALRLAITTFVNPGGPIGMAEPSYSLYPVLADIHDSPVARIDLDDQWRPPRDFAHRLNEAGSELAFLVNPHARSGTLMDTDSVSQLANDLNGVLLLDEAYIDFVDPSLRHDAVRLINAFDNLLILRSFSKGYGLAGLRLGYLLGQASLIEPMVTKTRDSYNVNLLNQVLGLAAFEDQDYAARTWERVRADRRRLHAELQQLGLDAPPSQTNFLLVTVPFNARRCAQELYLALKDQGVLVRWFDTPLLKDKLRISVGTPEQNQRLLACLAALLI